MKRDDNFFVGIYDPVDVRRNLLESSKEIIKSLQSVERLESIRNEKLKLFRKKKELMNELDILVSKLRDRLPKAYLRKALDNKELLASKPLYTSKQKFSSELEKLEQELRNVETELSSLK